MGWKQINISSKLEILTYKRFNLEFYLLATESHIGAEDRRQVWSAKNFQFNSVYFYRVFYSTIVSRCFTVRKPEPEPPGKHSDKKKLNFNREKP